MANLIRHFEVEADDLERAKRFYERVFGWAIRPWGPPNYYLIDAGDGMSGDIRERSIPKVSGNVGFVCTIVVEDLQASKAAVVANGGTIVVPEFTIDGVGDLLYFTDTEGHRVGLMQRLDG
jgi:uncharacterized protein